MDGWRKDEWKMKMMNESRVSLMLAWMNGQMVEWMDG